MLLPRLAERVVDQIEIVIDGFLAIAKDHEIDEVRQGFRINIGNSPAYQDQGIALITLRRQEWDAGQCKHLQQVQIVVLIRDGKANKVKIAQRTLRFEG